MPLGEEFVFIAIPLGIIIGTLCSMVGLGGGILIVPISIFLLGFDPKSAIVISLFGMTGLTVSASINYMKKKMVNYRLALLYNIWDIPGIILGGIITIYIAGNILAGICGIVIIFLAIMLFKKEKSDDLYKAEKVDKKEDITKKQNDSKLGIDNPYIASLSSFSGGLITGLVGLGGGTADTTSMILLGMEPKKAAATSEFAMASTVFFGIIIHFIIGTYYGSLIWPIFMAIGTIIGAQIGSFLSTKTDSKMIRKVLAILAFYTGVLLIFLMFNIGWVN